MLGDVALPLCSLPLAVVWPSIMSAGYRHKLSQKNQPRDQKSSGECLSGTARSRLPKCYPRDDLSPLLRVHWNAVLEVSSLPKIPDPILTCDREKCLYVVELSAKLILHSLCGELRLLMSCVPLLAFPFFFSFFLIESCADVVHGLLECLDPSLLAERHAFIEL